MDFLEKVYFQSFPGPIRKGDLKRYEIIKTAISVLATEGVDGIAFDQIAAKLETRRSHISYYFSTPQDLFTAIFQYITATAQAITVEDIKKAQTPRERIRAVGTGALRWVKAHRDQAQVILLLQFMFSYDPALKKMNTGIRQIGRERLQSLFQLALGRQEGTEALAGELQLLLTGMVVEAMSTAQSSQPDFKAILENFLGRCLPEASR